MDNEERGWRRERAVLGKDKIQCVGSSSVYATYCVGSMESKVNGRNKER